jgi:hypothetical protein
MQVSRDSDRMPDSGRKTRLQLYARLWSYVQLRSEDLTPVERRDSSWKTLLRSVDAIPIVCVTSVICPTLIGRCDSGRMLDFGWKKRL